MPNHTSDRHPWFAEALAAPPGSPARDRYIFRDGTGEGGAAPPSDWQSVFGGSAWRRVGDGQWYLHLFAPEQPDLNWENPEVVAEFEDILRFWLDRGVDGFRFDVAHGMAKDLTPPLRDLGPRQVHHGIVGAGDEGTHPFWDRDEVHAILRRFRAVLDGYRPTRAAVAESWAERARRAHYTRPDELHQAFNFDFLKADWNATALRAVIDRSLTTAGPDAAPTWVLSNHDVVRHRSRLALPPGTDPDAWLLTGGTRPAVDPALALRRAAAAALLLLALPGCAYLYQGEELGLPEVPDLPEAVLRDPVRRRSGGARKGRDGCRIPLPWTRTAPARSWLPRPADWAALSVEAQQGEKDSTLELYRAAIHLRRRLRTGGATLRWSREAAPGTLDFTHGALRCVVNLAADPVPAPAARPLLISAGLPGLPATGDLPPDTALWLPAAEG